MRATRRWSAIACVAMLALPATSVAQKHGKVWRVGFLAPRRHLDPSESDHYDEVGRGLRDFGYVEGKNLVIEWRFADGNYERLPSLAKELVNLDVDVIVVDGTTATLAAQRATKTIPIIFGSAGDPVGNGLVKSLAHPGANTTGISLLAENISAKQIELLTRVVPGLTRVAILHNPTNPYSLVALKGVRTAAQVARVEILPVEARTPEEIEMAFATMVARRAGAFVYVPDAMLYGQRRQIAGLAAAHRLPGTGGFDYAYAGGFMGYGPSQAANYRRAAAYVAKIFQGTNPKDLPVEQPTNMELVINRRSARALGLEIPPDVLVLATRVIE